VNVDKLCISDLNCQILCEILQQSKDGMGGQQPIEGIVGQWQFYFELWAAIEWGSPRKMVVGDRVQTSIPITVATHFDVRFDDFSRLRLKLLQNGKLLRIIGASNYKMQNRWHVINCEEGTGQ
jgi:head-tail adaptor